MMNNKLYVLWTSDNEVTSEKMVLMYVANAKINKWWDHITLIIWGASNTLIAESEMIREKIKSAQHAGVHVSACKACADQLGTTQLLLDLGVEVKYWGENLTQILKDNEKLLTI